MTTPLLSVVVPCLNEEAGLAALYARVAAAWQPYEAAGVELVLVDDGSQDGTWQHICALHAHDARVRGVRLSRNYGHQRALTCALNHARGERILILDADLQDPPELLATMMQRMDAGFDVVYGRRTTRAGESWFKRASAAVYYRVLRSLSDVEIPLDTGDFRLMRRNVLEALQAMPESGRFTRGMVSWVGFSQTAVEYARAPRATGHTHYTLRQMVRLGLEGITSFSMRPLQLALWLGVSMVMLSLGLLAYVFVSWALFDTARGWTSLMAVFLVFQGIQWVFLGIIGNYLGMVYRETKRRPHYIVRETTG